MQYSQRGTIAIFVCWLIILFSWFIILFWYFDKPSISHVDITSRNDGNYDVTLNIRVPLFPHTKITSCGYKLVNTKDEINWTKKNNNTCSFNGINGEYVVFIKDNNKNIKKLNTIKVNDTKTNKIKKKNKKSLIKKLLSEEIKEETIYLIKGESYNLDYISSSSHPTWVSTDDNIVTIDGNNIVAKNNGSVIVTGLVNMEKNVIRVNVTSLVNKQERYFDFSKPYIPCERYSEEEAKILDKLLEFKVKKAGYQTRAGVVEAARFLTLNFPYRLPYFFENGRLNPHYGHKTDGEGRYYHKGLYLSKSKYNDIKERISGPSMWGCNLTNYDNSTSAYAYLARYPNGLDCSGFVSWALYNGGIVLGDVGAGDDPYHDDDLSDVGTYVAINYYNLQNGKIKVGDLIGNDGHAAIIVGIDDNNVYVAESNLSFKGLVMNTYSWANLPYNFSFVRSMDNIYKGEGNLTKTWF